VCEACVCEACVCEACVCEACLCEACVGNRRLSLAVMYSCLFSTVSPFLPICLSESHHCESAGAVQEYGICSMQYLRWNT